jgi:hypothetical protein
MASFLPPMLLFGFKSPAHALKKEHLVPLYNNLPASVQDRPWKFVWVVPERDIGEVLPNGNLMLAEIGLR